MFGADDPLFMDDVAEPGAVDDGDVTDTEEAYTRRCEEQAAERAARAGVPAAAAPDEALAGAVVPDRCVAVRPTARRYFRRCAGCNAAIRSSSASRCEVCAHRLEGVRAADDRRKRRAHRPTHRTATSILIDDGKVRSLRNTAFGLEGDAHAAAMRRDVDRLADAVIGRGHAENRSCIDHAVDSFVSVVSLGAVRFVDDPAAGAAVTMLPPSLLASFYYSYGTQDTDDNQVEAQFFWCIQWSGDVPS